MRRGGVVLFALVLTLGTSFALHARDEGGVRSRLPRQAGSGLASPGALPGWFELPVPGGAATLDALGIAADERAFTLPILARALQERDGRVGITQGRLARVLAGLPATSARERDVVAVPVPLEAKIWWQLLPPPDGGDLFLRLLGDRNALLVAVGLMATHDSVRNFLARDRDLLRFIYQNAAGPFAVVARRLRMDGTRVAVGGGEHADAVWRALAGEPPTRPGPFLRALLTKDQGRLAWYFDTIGGLDPSRLAAAWTGTHPVESASDLYASFRDADPQWRIQEQPFRRNVADAWIILLQNDVSDGRLVSPLPREVWELIFSTSRLGVEQLRRVLQGKTTPVTLAWLARETTGAPMRERRHRLEMFRLAQRAFAGAVAAELSDISMALAGLREHRALLFALERMQIRAPATWAAAVEAARHVSSDADDRKESVAAFQATLGTLERIRHVRTIDRDTADRLVRGLSDAVRVDRRVLRSLGKWIAESLVRELPALITPDALTGKTSYESILLQALAGPFARNTPRIEWEGLKYSVDIVAAEHARLLAVRALLPSPGLDDAIASGRPRALVDALMTVVYATALGDPAGPVSLSPDVVSRHDFGLGGTAIMREELPWAPPEERQGVGPWRVQGAVLGLDLGLSRLVLRRVADEEMPTAPTLTLNDLGTLTRTAVALVAADLQDTERDELAAAIARGRERVRTAAGADALAALAAECAMPETARQLLPWIKRRQPEGLARLFSLRDLMWLGRPLLTRAQMDRWGVAADGIDGRRVTAMPSPASWEDYAGRSEAGLVTTQVPDLTLRLVEETARLKLPAVLVPALLGFALEDFWHEVQARFADDWPQLTRQAAALPSARIHDYVAALAGDGPLRKH